MSAESNRRLEQGGRSRVRSNLCEVEKARRRNMEQSMSGAKAKRRDQQLSGNVRWFLSAINPTSALVQVPPLQKTWSPQFPASEGVV